MLRIISMFLLLLSVIFTSAQEPSRRWAGAGEYLPGMSAAALMKQMAAEKKIEFDINTAGAVEGRLTTTYKHKAPISQEQGDQNFILSGKFDTSTNKLLLVVTHFRSRPDTSESYLTFAKPDSVYYDLSVSKLGNRATLTGTASASLNRNANTEWVGSFRGGGLSRNAGDNSMHILPLRIRFDIEAKQTQPEYVVANAVYRDTLSAAPTTLVHNAIHNAVRRTKVQRTIVLDTSHIKIELYDNGQVDGDIATLMLDGKTVIDRHLLSTKAAVLTLDVAEPANEHVLELYANNQGSIPPNTALVVLTCRNKRYEINLASDEVSNGAVKLVFKH